MASKNRKIAPEVEDIFDKYIRGNMRNLKRPEAMKMLTKEFKLKPDEAEAIFNNFDKDGNGVMSIWEFQQFYMMTGNSVQEIVAKFHELDEDDSGALDVNEARKGLAAMTVNGRLLQDKEIDFFITSSARGEDNTIDLGEFVSLMAKLKLYKPPN
ncbi:calmodulin-beta [Lingula anatina]|uniref:Calmodulin-beta n=1 Tax=Lingula anatina TaxID=7574 RepID=A0A1S3HTJ8_LINAN|nr:calmodulin-beta [Lingula anatina]|eukprot:XP_013388384.1 calmodulin-beta [Lingula anatina]